jgi:hypothetical protein
MAKTRRSSHRERVRLGRGTHWFESAGGPMTSARSVLLASILCGAGLAGCGSSSNSSSTRAGRSATDLGATSTITSASPHAASSRTESQYVPICKAIGRRERRPPARTKAKVEPICNRASSGAAFAQYMTICQSIVGRAASLSAQVKARAEGTCNKASSGSAARVAAKEVCLEVVSASPISSVRRAKELAACKRG